MEAPRVNQESRRFRWVGRPSEEELLGTPVAGQRFVSGSRARALTMSPPPTRAPRIVSGFDPLEEAPRWRFQRRDLISVAAIAVAVWFAIRGSEGLPFHSSKSLEPVQAIEIVGTSVALDRHEMRSLARLAASERASAATAAKTRSKNGGPAGSGSGSGSGSKDKPKPPPTGTSDPPLLQANLPVLGPVTVDQPDVPDTSDLPLPPAPDVPETPTLPTLP